MRLDSEVILWKEAILCSNLVMQFTLSILVVYFSFRWLEQKFQIPWLALGVSGLCFPLLFWRLMKSLENFEKKGLAEKQEALKREGRWHE